MKYLKVLAIVGALSVFGLAPSASAYYPTLSVNNNGGNSILTVSNAAPNSSVQLSYTPSGSSLATTVSNFGYTDGSGNFTTNVSSSSYGLSGASQIYVTVGGQQSNTVSGSGSGPVIGGCGYYGCSVGGLTLSQSSLSLSVGQSAAVTATYPVYGYSNTIYVSSNSNSAVASASVSGSQVNIYGLASGSTTISICASGSACGTVYVTVSGSGGGCGLYGCSVGGLTLSQTSVSLNVGQTSYVTASMPIYNPSFYVSSNSNSGAVSASISGSQISLYGLASGSSTVTICTSGGSTCGSVYVTVSGSGSGCGIYGCSVGGLTLSQTSVSLNVGQTTTVTASMPIYNPSFYVSSNSNSGAVSANVSGSQVSLYGLAAGSSTVTICTSGGSTCGTVYVTVSGVLGTNTNLWFSPGNPSLYVGQSLAVSINSSSYNNYGSTAAQYYNISSNSNSGAVSASISGTVLNLYANQSGTSNITVCSSSLGFCGTLTATVGGGGVSGNLSLSQTNISLTLGQNTTVTAYNSYGSTVYVSNNTNPSAVSTSISGNVVYLNSVAAGSSTITICASGYSGNCGTVYVTVNGGGGGTLSFSPSNPTLYAGQSLSVSVYNNFAAYGLFISANTSPNVVSASISGNTLTLYANSSGTSNITVCTSGSAQCGTLYVTVSGSGGYNYGSNIFFTPSSLNLTIGQSNNVTVTGPYSYNFSISGNSAPTVASAVMQGNVLTVTGTNSGYTTFNICQNGVSQCGSLGVTVNNGYGYNGGYNYGNGTLSLSQTSVSLSAGQTAYVTAYNGSGYGLSVSSNSNVNVVSASVSGSQIVLLGLASGNSTVVICQSGSNYGGSNGCANVYVTVGTNGNLTYPSGSGSSVLGVSIYANGQLISENGTVYIVYQNTKTGFVSAAVFRALGFKFGNVAEVGSSGLADSGYTVRTAAASHPWGSWIKSGQTVYFVHDSGLIPVPNMNTFASNGGQAAWIVPANHYDFSLPIMSPMTVGDSRLQ